MRPVIGINLCLRPNERRQDDAYFLQGSYVQAVVKAGGLPCLIPVVEDPELVTGMMERVDGLLLTGGDPEYRAATVEKVDDSGKLPDLPGLQAQNPRRHAFDLTICRLALEKNMPVLGICRGHQTLNEAAGGTMFLNLHRVTDWQHRQVEPMDVPTHAIKLAAGSLLADIMGYSPGGIFQVNSFHRQAVDRPAPGFTASCHSPDGIVEAVESREHDFALGVQFHPETLLARSGRFIEIYRQLVIKAARYRLQYKM